MVTARKSAAPSSNEALPDMDRWELRLYVAGQTPRSVEAFARLKEVCDAHLEGRYSIEVIDLLINPTLAAGDQIIAIPTVVRKLPSPMKKIIGDLSNMERVLVGLDLTAVRPNPRATTKAEPKPKAKPKKAKTKAKAR